jgi:hypothetical protein
MQKFAISKPVLLLNIKADFSYLCNKSPAIPHFMLRLYLELGSWWKNSARNIYS